MIAYIEGRQARWKSWTTPACWLPAAVLAMRSLCRAIFLSRLPAGKSVLLYLHGGAQTRWNCMGFPSWDERQTLFVLTSISRIGAKTALSILTVFRPDDLRELVAAEDVLALTRVPGIGKKTAQQLF